MTKAKLLERLCAVARKVKEEKLGESILPKNCFCGAVTVTDSEFQCSESVIAFIESAVQEKIQRESDAGLKALILEKIGAAEI